MTGAQQASLPRRRSLGSSEHTAVVTDIPGYSAAVLGTLGNSYRPSAFAPAHEEHSQLAGENMEYWLSRVSGWSPV